MKSAMLSGFFGIEQVSRFFGISHGGLARKRLV